MNDKANLYEAMFLLDSGDFEAAKAPAEGILTRYGAQILAMKPWDDRRLAYEVAGRKRGLYVLTYFKADPARIAEIEHDCQLDERILRSLIIRHESLSDETINALTPATGGGQRAPEPGERVEEDRPDRDRWSRGDRESRYGRGPREADKAPAEEAPAAGEETPRE
jgi:small subunit ribosomal protein S6